MATYHILEVLLICLSNSTVFCRITLMWIVTGWIVVLLDPSGFCRSQACSLNVNIIRTIILTLFRSLKVVLMPIIFIFFHSEMQYYFYLLCWQVRGIDSEASIWPPHYDRSYTACQRPNVRIIHLGPKEITSEWVIEPVKFIWNSIYYLAPVCSYSNRVWDWCFMSLMVNINSDPLCNSLEMSWCFPVQTINSTK